MSQQTPELAANPGAQTVNEWVNKAYDRLASAGQVRIRETQVNLSWQIARTLILGKTQPLAAEAPTGTGKTLAYLVGALAAYLKTGKTTVVATATKALQQQLVSTDLPKLVAAGLLRPDQVLLVKGRGNYLCPRDANLALSTLKRNLNDPEAFVDDQFVSLDPDEVEAMLQAFETGTWGGDFDLYEGPKPKVVFPIASSSDTCSRTKCDHYEVCPFFKARKDQTSKALLVTNHDLMLRDFAMFEDTGQGILTLADFNIVVDEAHHLPDKAIAAGTAEVSISSLLLALPKLTGAERLIKGSPEFEHWLVTAANLRASDLDKTKVASLASDLFGALEDLEVSAESNILRFPKAVLPPKVESTLRELFLHAQVLKHAVDIGVDAGNDRSGDSIPLPATQKARMTEFGRRLLDVKRVLDALMRFQSVLDTKESKAVWLFHKDNSITLTATPLDSSVLVDRLVWKNPRVYSAALVSATLRDLGGFDRFTARAGLPKESKCYALPYSFPYEKSQILVPAMKATPKYAERKAYFAELRSKLPACINAKEGTLLLFPSWSMLKEFAPLLRARFGEHIRFQGEQTVRMLVKAHCDSIDRGQGAILAGVATMAEGLDLPGKYCTHVVIMALPFSSPNDPVEEELAEMLGKNYFAQRSLPDAMAKLAQMVGRLLRRETDEGRVTLFDRRLASTSYGQRMLQSLPPFQQVIEPQP